MAVGTWAYWGLSEGIGPGQPFLVHVLPPRWYESGWEVREWDVEWTWDLIHVMPRKPENAAKSWQRYVDRQKRYEEKSQRLLKRLRYRREHDPKALLLKWESYWAHGYADGPPDGIRVHLDSKHIKQDWVTLNSYLAEGEDNDGSRQVALAKLLTAVKTKYPHLSDVDLGKLPYRW